MSDPMWDVVVVGGGPAGSATAALLAAAGHQVLLADRARFPRAKACAEYISPGAARIVKDLDRAGRVSLEARGRRLRGMQLHAPHGQTHLLDYGRTDEGPWSYALDREQLDRGLLENAADRGVTVLEATRVSGVERDGDRVRGILIESPGRQTRVVRSRVVVGADGLHSVVARSLGLRRKVLWPYRLGLVAHLGNVRWEHDYGEMHVGRDGYVGVAPLDDQGLVSVGLVTGLEQGHLGSPESALRRHLACYPALAERLVSGLPVRRVQGVGPLAARVAQPAGAGYVLVGDAAGFFDPFTGEGIYRALRGAQVAAGVISHALASGRWSSDQLARDYIAARRRVFAAKERLTALIQVFVEVAPLMDYAVERLRGRPEAARQLALVLGDIAPASLYANPGLLWGLLRP